jgi:bile acid:Na+ symporter, BASS family
VKIGDHMNAQELVVLALKTSIFLTVFGFGLQATTGDVLYLLRKPGLLVRSLLAMFLVMPLFAVFMTRAFDYHRAVAIALVALAISPVPPLLPKKVTKAGGRQPYGIGLMVTATVLSIVFIPLALDVIGRIFDRPFAMGAGAVAKLVVVSALLPLAAGMAFRAVAPDAAQRFAKPVSRVATVLLALGALAILVSVFPVAWALIGNGTVFVFVAFVVFGLAVGHFLGGPDSDERVTLALSTACRHPALAIAIAGANFPDEKRVAGAVVLYLLLNALVCFPYIAWQRRTVTKATTQSVVQAH